MCDCESSFSIVNYKKLKTQNRLDSQMLSACISLALTEIPVSDGSMGGIGGNRPP